MSPAISLVVTALERTAVLIEKGVPPAKALRQCGQELTDYAEAHHSEMVPGRPFAGELAVPQRRIAA